MLLNKDKFFQFYIFITLKCQEGIGYNCQIYHPLFIILLIIILILINNLFEITFLKHIFMYKMSLFKYSNLFVFLSVLPKYRRSAGQILMPRSGIIVFL